METSRYKIRQISLRTAILLLVITGAVYSGLLYLLLHNIPAIKAEGIETLAVASEPYYEERIRDIVHNRYQNAGHYQTYKFYINNYFQREIEFSVGVLENSVVPAGSVVPITFLKWKPKVAVLGRKSNSIMALCGLGKPESRATYLALGGAVSVIVSLVVSIIFMFFPRVEKFFSGGTRINITPVTIKRTLGISGVVLAILIFSYTENPVKTLSPLSQSEKFRVFALSEDSVMVVRADNSFQMIRSDSLVVHYKEHPQNAYLYCMENWADSQICMTVFIYGPRHYQVVDSFSVGFNSSNMPRWSFSESVPEIDFSTNDSTIMYRNGNIIRYSTAEMEDYTSQATDSTGYCTPWN